MIFVAKNFIYYMCSGLAIGLLMYLTFGLLYANKMRVNLQVSFSGEGEPVLISSKEKTIRKIIFFLGTIGILVAEFFLIPGHGTPAELVKTLAFALGFCAYATLSTLDIKYGEAYVFELGITNTLILFIIPIIVDFIFGSRTVGLGLLITFAVYIIVKVVNYAFNKELSVGGADVDTIAALIAASVGIFFAINRMEELPIFVISYFFERLLSLVFVNFAGSIIIYYIVRAIKATKNKKTNDEDKSESEVKETENVTEEGNAEESVNPELVGNAESEDTEKAETKTMIQRRELTEDEKKAREKMNFRCLPSFFLIYTFILFFVLFYN